MGKVTATKTDVVTKNSGHQCTELAAGTSVTWRCEYDNSLSFPLQFGDSAVVNEQCNLQGVYVADSPVQCN